MRHPRQPIEVALLRRLSDLREMLVPVRAIIKRIEWLERRLTPPQSGALAASDKLNCILARNEHGSYLVPQSSLARPAAQDILHGRVWEPETINLVCRHVGNGDVIHAGAYFGDFLPAISKATAGTLWAFEPNFENYCCAQATVLLNGLSNVCLMNVGLSDVAAKASMLVRNPDGSGLGGGSRIGSGDASEIETIDLVRLDDVIPKTARISVLQLDVEGHEGNAVRGAAMTIERCLPLLILETVPSDGWATRFLQSLGYSSVAKVHGNTVLRPISTAQAPLF